MALVFRIALCLAACTGAAAAQPAPTAQATDLAASSEILCKRFREAGTLIKKRKICMTRSEWSQLSEDAQRNVQHLQFSNMGGNDGCKVGQPC